MNTTTLAAGVIGFLLGGLTVSVAAALEDDGPEPAPTHGGPQVSLFEVVENEGGPVRLFKRTGCGEDCRRNCDIEGALRTSVS